MEFAHKIGGRQGILTIVGSGIHWAWFDALFMSALFVEDRPYDLMPEIAAILVFAFCVPVCLFTFVKSSFVERCIRDRRCIVAFAVLGTCGSLLFVVSGMYQQWWMLVLGGIFGGAYMGFAQLGWCAAYSQKGARTATPFVAGAFACAVALSAAEGNVCSQRGGLMCV